MTTRRAACCCGQLHLTIEGEPSRISMCHCLECQRRTGAVWMQYPDRREEAVGGAGELLPAHECTLAASFGRLEPTPSHLVELPPHARAVSGNGIVVQVPFEHPLQPCSGLGNGVVHSFAQLHLDLLQLLQHPLLDRLAPDNERAPFA